MAEVSQILIGAMKDVEDADVPEDLREIAFKEAIRLRETSAGLVPGGDGALGTGGGAPGGAAVVGDGAIAQIAARFGVDPAQVGEVFTERDGEVLLAIGTKALSSGKRPATKEIALLVAGARQATGEEWTSVNSIREWCETYGKYDNANFAKTIADMEDLFQFTGKGQRREVRLRQPAWEAAGELVSRIVGGE
jgi:hypothetical protein